MLATNVLIGPTPDESNRLSGQVLTFTHPDDVLHSPSLSVAEKRALLAEWASDAHAVANLPTMRQLHSGALISVDTILAGLQALDASDTAQSASDGKRGNAPRLDHRPRWCQFPRSRDHDDNDDPPPCPASALPPLVEHELRRRRDEAWGLLAA